MQVLNLRSDTLTVRLLALVDGFADAQVFVLSRFLLRTHSIYTALMRHAPKPFYIWG